MPEQSNSTRPLTSAQPLAGKVAIVTGAGSGIGRAIAIRFATAGARIGALNRSETRALETVHTIEAGGGTALPLVCDVSRQADVFAAFRVAQDRFGPVDILVNSAGMTYAANLEQTSEEDLDRLYAVNVKGVYNCLKAAIPVMKGRGGAILNVASVASSIGLADRFAYSATKGAVLTMTYSIARDYIHDNVRCNCISPARIHTPLIDELIAKNYPGREAEMFDALSRTQPIGRMGRAEEVAELALFLCSDAAAFITGSNYAIDGGFVTLKMP
jgi:NAD(P)-dependent dehydrogenase (short-subunit alcohol dehydrogenase family)